MLNWVDRTYLTIKFKAQAFVEDLLHDESGVSNFVATVLLILMVVLIAGAIWGFLSGWFTDLFTNIKNGTTTMSSDDIKT